MSSLQQELDAFSAQIMPKMPASAKAIMKNVNQSLLDGLPERNLVKVGDTLPAFALQNQEGETVSSVELLQQGPLVISFFRGVWCPYCNIEVKALEAHAQAIRELGANLVVISPQTQAAAKRSVTENGLSFDVLSDQANGYAQKLDIAFALPADLKRLYQGFGINLSEYNGDDSWSLPMPARIVVSQEGKVLAFDVNPDYTQRPEPSETLSALPKYRN
ncbi:peroxiredoxin-like family protein [Marinomonas epiphytica]